MKITRVIFCTVVSMLVAQSALAQSSATATARAGVVITSAERFVAPVGLPRPLPGAPTVLHGQNFKVTGPDSAWRDVSDISSIHPVVDTVWNLTNDSQSIYFSRSQHLGSSLSSSVCWGGLCYPKKDSVEVWTIPPLGSALLTLDLSATLNDVPDSGAVWLRVGVVGSPADTVQLYYTASYTPPDPPLVFLWSQPTQFEETFNGPGVDTLSNMLENYAARGIDYVLSYQALLPAGWSITKFDDTRQPYNPSNYQDTFTTGNTLVTNFSALPDTTYQQRLTFTLNVPTVTTEDSAVIYLSVHPQTSNPADSANYRFVMYVMPPASVATAPEERAGIAVTNAWPNPLVGNGTLHLEIQTDAGGASHATIYDLTGSEKGTLDLGSLHPGTNEIQVSAPNLPSGDYILRVTQGGLSSEVVRFNYVK